MNVDDRSRARARAPRDEFLPPSMSTRRPSLFRSTFDSCGRAGRSAESAQPTWRFIHTGGPINGGGGQKGKRVRGWSTPIPRDARSSSKGEEKSCREIRIRGSPSRGFEVSPPRESSGGERRREKGRERRTGRFESLIRRGSPACSPVWSARLLFARSDPTSKPQWRTFDRRPVSLSLLPRGRERLPIAGRSGTKRRNTLGFAVFRFLPWSASLCLPFRSHTPHQHAARARPRQRADLVNAPKVNRPFVPERIDRETSRPRRGEKEASRAINGFLDIDNPRMSRDRAAMRGTEGRRRNGNGGTVGGEIPLRPPIRERAARFVPVAPHEIIINTRRYCAAKLIRKRGSRLEQWARARDGAGRDRERPPTQWGTESRRSDLRPPALHRLAFAFGFARPDCVLMPRLATEPRDTLPRPAAPLPLHTPLAAARSFRRRVSMLAGRGSGEEEIRAKPRQRRGRRRG